MLVAVRHDDSTGTARRWLGFRAHFKINDDTSYSAFGDKAAECEAHSSPAGEPS